MRIMKLIAILIIFSLFAGIAGASFLDDEAGISAYTKANTNINLDNAKNSFRTVERQTADYIIGSVALTGLSESEDVHIYVNKNGWIVAYYLNAEPASKIMNWKNYNGEAVFPMNKLVGALLTVTSAAGVTYQPVKYYDFKYPAANRLMIIVKWNGQRHTESFFNVMIPSSFVLNEASYSHYDLGIINCCAGSKQTVDGITVSTANNGVNYNKYSSTIFTPDISHTIKLLGIEGAAAGVATTIIYNEP